MSISIVLWTVILLVSTAKAELPDDVVNSSQQHFGRPLLTLNSDNSAKKLVIKNAEQNMVLDIPRFYLPGKDIYLRQVHGEDNQVFNLRYDSGDNYRLINPASGLYLQSLPGSDLVHLGTEGTLSRSLWNLKKVGDTAYTFQNEGNLLCMDAVPWNIGGSGYSVGFRSCDGKESQNWILDISK